MATPDASFAEQLGRIAAGLDELDAVIAAGEPVIWLEPATTFAGALFVATEAADNSDAIPPEADER